MLTYIIFIPIIGALLIALTNRDGNPKFVKAIALVFSAIPFILSAAIFASSPKAPSGYLYEEHFRWMPSLGISYHIALDSLSLSLILLNGLLCILSVISSFYSIDKKQKAYYIFLLMLQCGINGTFASLDLILFYIFWETMLIPLYFLIGIWGSGKKIYAAMKFVLFTLAGSVLMLIAILFLFLKTRGTVSPFGSFDLPEILAAIESGKMILSGDAEVFLFLAFFIAFAIKVPLFPFHTWLPDAHTEAPTAGSVILAGVLLKTGVYGMIRFCIPLFPEAAIIFSPAIRWLAVIAIVYGALTAIAQTDMKRLIAYSSVSHMGFIVLGLFSFSQIAVEGSIVQMINHGISTGGLFLCVGLLYNRRHTRELSQFGGLAQNMKVYSVMTIILVLSSAGLPGLNGFVGEFTILLGTFGKYPLLAIIGSLGIILSAVYLLMMVQKVFFGALDKDENKKLKDIGLSESSTLIPLIVLAFLIGLWASPFFGYIKAPAASAIKAVTKVLK